MPAAVERISRHLKRSAEVLHAIEVHLRRYDLSPTVRDLCHATGITSTSYVYYLLAELELDGYITRQSGVSRSIRLTRPRGVPIAGTIAAGQPLDLFDAGAPEMLDLAAHTQGGDDDTSDGATDEARATEQAFRVHGDSMIEDGILDGDYVLVCPGRTAPEGATVVAVHKVQEASERGAATLKRLQFDHKRKRVLLCPANAAFSPIVVPMQVWEDEWEIHGTVTAIYRPYGQLGQSGRPRPRSHSTRLRAS